MSVSLTVLGAQGAAASPAPLPSAASSGFTWADAAIVFVLVILALLILVAFVGRRTRRLSYRPRLHTEREVEVREAAEEDVEAIEDDSWVTRRDIPGSRDDDL
jgi:membrane protein implicated in regulation of membrane protease activity